MCLNMAIIEIALRYHINIITCIVFVNLVFPIKKKSISDHSITNIIHRHCPSCFKESIRENCYHKYCVRTEHFQSVIHPSRSVK